MRRREFIAGLGAAAWPLAAWAQQSEKLPTIGVLMGWDENDDEARAYVAGLTQGLSELGWTVGRNIHMAVRWEASSVDRKMILAKGLVALQPDVIVSGNTPETDALRRETMTIPIVFGLTIPPTLLALADQVIE